MRLLFVCTGNTCRSPMATAIARRLAAERGLTDLEIASAGTGAIDGSGASDGAMLVVMERGGDLGSHRSRALTAELVARADLVLVMGDRHLARVEELGGVGRAFLLTEYASQEQRGVSDPYGGDLATYRATYDELEREVRRALQRLVPTGATGDAG